MATGPQKYPGANTAHWWQTKWGGDLMEVNVGVLHTTEGVGLTDYNGGAVAPNLTAVANFARKRLDWYQHFDIDRSSRALQNLAGGVETNTLNVVQVELEGTCDYSKRERWGSRVAGRDYIYWGAPPDWALDDLADFLRWLNAEHGVPLAGPSMWLNYGPDVRRQGVTPASYGASPARMSFTAWEAFRGVCGHQHVPENDHGDPGSLPFAKLIALAKGQTTDPEEDPMAGMTKQDIYDAVWKTDQVAAPEDAPDAKTNPTWQPQSYLKDIDSRVRGLETTVDGLSTPVLSDAQVAALASAVAASPSLSEQIAEKVAVKLAARLAQ